MLSWFKKKPTGPSEPFLEVAAGTKEDWRARGNTFLDEGKLPEAAECYLKATHESPEDAASFVNLGYAYGELGRIDEARNALQAALALDARLPDPYYMLGNIARSSGDARAAIDCYWKALAIKPDFVECARDLLAALIQADRRPEAERLLATGQTFPVGSQQHHFFSGLLRMSENALQEAAEHFRRADALDPYDAANLTNLGLVLHKQGDVFAAMEIFRRVLQLTPDSAHVHCNLGGSLQVSGSLEPAIKHYKKALALDSGHMEAFHNLLYALSFAPGALQQPYLETAIAFGKKAQAGITPHTSWPNCNRVAGHPLRVGLVSGDMRNHPVGAFLEAVLSYIDPARLTLVAYSNLSKGDGLTARIKPFFSAWNVVAGVPDEVLAARIQQDRIDVLIDLAGHTAHNRLRVFCWKPAPVQVAWLGYWASTGMPTMDYILVDPISVPKDGPLAQFSEAPWYLPDTRMCFTAPETVNPAQVGPLPALANGYVTFGSFQLLSKMSDDSLRNWARVLLALPGSRLRLQNWQLGFSGAKQDMLNRLEALGVSPARVDFHGGSPRHEYLLAHGDVDIVLDTFPFPGGTTTVEALWMGVPTLTLTGDTLLNRQGESLLRCAGLADWVAQDDDEYVERALAHAGDLVKLAGLRAGLRNRVLGSPLFDAERFARHFEDALHGMWNAKVKAGKIEGV